MTNTALILFTHGSLLCGAGRTVEAHAQRIRGCALYPHVSIAYLNYGTPGLESVLSDLVLQGINHVTVVPYFLTPGKFVVVDLAAALRDAKLQFPSLRIAVGEPIGDLQELEAAILDSATQAGDLPSLDEALNLAGIACEKKPSCPLFGTGACMGMPQ